MDKCPYCGADTRPGDNFCLNCGNRLPPVTPSSPNLQAQAPQGEATLAATEDWSASPAASAPTVGWSPEAAPSAEASEQTVADDASSSSPVAQATLDRINEPAHLLLRSESGEILQEYALDKAEITIGRAPNSDILLSKDKLTSRRHATVRFEQNRYRLHDEHSANGTFVNGQQIEDETPYDLQEGDLVGIGEHELVFRGYQAVSATPVEDLPTIAVPFNSPLPAEMTYRTREDAHATIQPDDEFGTNASADIPESAPAAPAANHNYSVPATPAANDEVAAAPELQSIPETPSAAPEPVVNSVNESSAPAYSADKPVVSARPTSSDRSDAGVTFNRLTGLSSPVLPDMSALVAALSTLDGQVKELQDQINSTQDAIRSHDTEVVQTTNQLRSGIRRVSDRMDNTIADVARSREALAWAELLQLMEDVMNNPRDIEYVTKLARKARELNKVFQIHQNVLNTMAECNSLLRSMIGEDK